jgi:uncharacterized protein YdaL
MSSSQSGRSIFLSAWSRVALALVPIAIVVTSCTVGDGVRPVDAGGGSDAATPDMPGESSGLSVAGASDTRTLVLYDTNGDYGWLGELYAVSAANLASHFGQWRARPAQRYECGSIASFTAVVYVGSTYDEPLPDCLLDDVLGSERPVIWAGFNSWQLVTRAGREAFVARFGFSASELDMSRFTSVLYDGRVLSRYADNPSMLGIRISDHALANELATANREDGTTSPWAVRSGNLTIVAENPFTFVAEDDRVLAFEDLLFDALAPSTPQRHRALVRVDAISPVTDPTVLRTLADALQAESVPFGFAVIAQYRDPLGRFNGGNPRTVSLADAPAVVDALRYMQEHGGTMVMHGYTHQWDGGANPYDGVSGDDTEFVRVMENPDHTFAYPGPLPEDSLDWANGRIAAARQEIEHAGLAVPTIWEFPYYSASANAYLAASGTMGARWERVVYYSGAFSHGAVDHSRRIGQMFPYVVRDVYGGVVIPESLGSLSTTRTPDDVIHAASRAVVVRDDVASFFVLPTVPADQLRQTITGIRALGYQFVSPAEL